MPSKDIQEFLAELKLFYKEREWEQFHNPKDVAVSLVLETAEVLEHFQWKNGTDVDTYLQEHKEDIADELADVFIYLINLSDKVGIDIIEASRHKMKKNAVKYPIEKSKGNNKKYTEL